MSLLRKIVRALLAWADPTPPPRKPASGPGSQAVWYAPPYGRLPARLWDHQPHAAKHRPVQQMTRAEYDALRVK